MSMAFKLSVPADPRFRNLLTEVSAKCAELAGGSAADGQAFAEALSAMLGKIATDPHGQVDLAFRPGHGGVEVTATFGGHSTVVRHAIPVAKR
jgi:hypothetical protein